jgi:hypothetical protein
MMSSGYREAVFVAALGVAVILAWIGVVLILDGWSNRRAADLTERLRPYQPLSVADEAQRWLEGR